MVSSEIDSKYHQNPGGITAEQALSIAKTEISDLNQLLLLLVHANKIRQLNKGLNVITCSIVNAKSGGCSEDCAFCSQSSFHTSEIEMYPLMSAEEILERALRALKFGAVEFSIVTSGKKLDHGHELKTIKTAISRIKDTTELTCCASLGTLEKNSLFELKKAGLEVFHHNLETSRNFFPRICSTRSFDENIDTIKRAKDLGFKVCCGGIFGMGESWDDRVELFFELKDLGVDSVPINFLNPIKGTKLEKKKLLHPFEALKIISLARLINPTVNIIICGGREVTIRDLQSLVFCAGANGILIGDYLTTAGRDAGQDIKMIEDQGLVPKRWID